MSRQDRIKEKVKKTIKLLNKETHLKTDPYFFTRLEARIISAEQLQPAHITAWQRWRPVMLAALAGVNILTAVFLLPHRTSVQERRQTINIMAQDYALVTESVDWLYQSVGE